jgi:ribosomal protein S18 acetylase RimI-like enzyme
MFIVSPLISSHINVNLKHANLTQSPVYAIPTGYTLRGYLPGDRKTWVSLLQVADPCLEVNEETFVEEFGRHQPSLISRQFYACTQEGKAVGTSTAWFAGKTSGLVKGLAVALAHSGRGLEEALLSEAIRRFENFGYEQARVSVGANRLDQIRLFMNFGFQPEVRSTREEAAWKDIQMALGDVARVPFLLRLAGWLRRLISNK